MIRQTALLLLTAGLLVGCESPANREIEKNFVRRGDNLRKTTGWFIESEQRRPGNLQKTAGFIEEQYRHDVQKTFVDNPATMENWLNEEFKHWQERQPAYLKGVGDELAGDLGSIERTIPKIID